MKTARSQHEQQAETGEQYDLRLVGGQHGGVMEDPVGDEPGKLGTQCGQQRRVGIGRAAAEKAGGRSFAIRDGSA